jgi:actin-related protein
MSHGIVNNWDSVERLWFHAFSELRIDPSEHPVLLSEPFCSRKASREKMAEIQFETFHVPSFWLARSEVLSLYASGRTTGIVLGIGDGVTGIGPYSEGYCLPDQVRRVNFAGRDLTMYLEDLLNARRDSFWTSGGFEVAQDIKERVGYVALDFKAELRRTRTSTDCNVNYTLPDGNEIVVGSERFRSSELLFKPALNGFEFKGIHHILFEQLMKCDRAEQSALFENIVVAGGTTMLTGFPERIQKEITRLAPWRLKRRVNVVAEPDRKDSTWIGGSILSSVSAFPSMLITREEYHENGAEIVLQKCF